LLELLYNKLSADPKYRLRLLPTTL